MSNTRRIKRKLKRASKTRVELLTEKKVRNELRHKAIRIERQRDSIGGIQMDIKAEIRHLITKAEKDEKRPMTMVIVPTDVYKMVEMATVDCVVHGIKVSEWDRVEHSGIILMEDIDVCCDMYVD